MSDKIIYRPRTLKSRVNTKDEFELCYMRHKYFRKAMYNPTEEQMEPYIKIVESQAFNTYYTYKGLFYAAGFELEDIVNIGKIHLVSFLNLFALESKSKNYDSFVKKFEKKYKYPPVSINFLSKNKADFTLFLKQRMEDTVRVCKQKARNIKGLLTEEYHTFRGKGKPPKNLAEFIDNYKQYGFQKIDWIVFRTARNKAKKGQNTKMFRFSRMLYVAFPVEHKNLELIDFAGSDMDPYDNIHNMNPEQILFHKEQEDLWESRKDDFRQKNKSEKTSILLNFIKSNSQNPKFEEEVKTAKKTLKNLGVNFGND